MRWRSSTSACRPSIATLRAQEVLWEETEVGDADFLLAGFGLSARICRSAVSALRREGVTAGLFRPITLWPFPEAALAKAAAGKKKVLVVEMNAGQMVEDVKLAVGSSVARGFPAAPWAASPRRWTQSSKGSRSYAR